MITAEEWARLRAEGDAEVAEWRHAEDAAGAPFDTGAAGGDVYAPFYIGEGDFGIDVGAERAYDWRGGLLESYRDRYIEGLTMRNPALLRALVTRAIEDPYGPFGGDELIRRAWAEACADAPHASPDAPGATEGAAHGPE